MDISELPARVGTFTPDGLTMAVRRVGPDNYGALAELLASDPRAVAERMLGLTSDQQKQLARMDDAELATVVAPVIHALRSGTPFKLDISYTYAEKKQTTATETSGDQQPPPARNAFKCHILVVADTAQ